MDEVLQDLVDCVRFGEIKEARDFEEALYESGFMIVPIEDPTNLRFGVDE